MASPGGPVGKLIEDEEVEESRGQPLEPPLPLSLPRAAPRDSRNRDRGGGYACELVDPPSPDIVQTECSVCLQILKEPCLISCCGHKFCRECIERVERNKKPCPLCNEPGFTYLRERGLERSLKDFDVRCSYRKGGCEWRGKLRDVDEHLNPSLGSGGCQFVEVECVYQCGAWFQRRLITDHETQQCRNRPYTCDFCQYCSTFEDITKVHYPQCGKCVIACPNLCDVSMVQHDLDAHLKYQCSHTLVDCPFRYVGCETQLLRKDMPEHMKENFIHITLLATFTHKLSEENHKLAKENQILRADALQRESETKKLIESYEETNRALLKRVEEVRLEAARYNKVQEQLTRGSLEIRKEIQKLNDSVAKKDDISEELRHSDERREATKTSIEQKCAMTDRKVTFVSLSTYANRHAIYHMHMSVQTSDSETVLKDLEMTSKLRSMYLPNFPMEFSVQHKKQPKKPQYSPPFYLRSQGYRMCIGVEYTTLVHYRISVCIMRGPFDAHLKWPFRGSITMQIVNQAGDCDHIERTVHFTDKTPDDIAGRVTGGELSSGQGFVVRDCDLERKSRLRKCLYIRNHSLILSVTKVT